MVRVYAIIAIIFVFSNLIFGMNCDEKNLCKGIDVAPSDREVNGRTLKGSNRPQAEADELYACRAKKCSYKYPERVEFLFNQAKTRIPNVIKKGRSESELSQSERAVVDSLVKNAQLLDPVMNAECGRYCMTGGMAARIPRGICVCPRLEGTSDEFLLYSIAHELGHMSDICNPQNTGLKLGQHPFETAVNGTTVLDCMKENGIAGRRPDEDKIYNKNLQKETATTFGLDPDSNTGAVVGTVLSPVKRLVQSNLKSAHCRGRLGCSHMQEASADIFGFEVLGDFLKEYPLDKNDTTNPRRLFSFMLADGCKNNSPDGHHPTGLDRVTKIGLSIPSIRESLGCTDYPAKMSCDYRPSASALEKGNSKPNVPQRKVE